MKVILTRSNSISSWLIRIRLSIARRRWERWSHALVVLEDGVIQSTFKAGGVRKGRLQDVLKHASVANVLTIDLRDEAAAASWLLAQVGKPYDWRACWGLAISSREWRDDYAWFCFELVAGAALAGGREVSTDASLITAHDLVDLAHG